LTIPGDAQAGLERDVLFTRREPYGILGAILPFNFPIDIFSHKVAPALATGNAVVLKPAEETPLTALRAAALLHQAGVPAEAMQVLTGRGPTVGQWLISSPRIQLLSFTGSTEVGIHIAQTAAKHLTRVFLELGGNDPMVVFADADLEEVARHAVEGRLVANGQCCCADKRIIAHRSIAGDLADALIERFRQVTMGDPLDSSVDLGPLISEDAARRAASQVRLTCEQGATRAYGDGEPDGAFLGPVVLTDVPSSANVARDMEVFAPVLPVIPFDDDEEAIEIANNSPYGLNASVFTRDMRKALTAAYGIQAGLVAVNGTGLYRPDAAPFGGYKMSGVGREGTTITLEEFTQLKTIALRDVLPGPPASEPTAVSGT
jgi:acyl-CoA reductase-like NAD-dependent aldehyde dehydrogenase